MRLEKVTTIAACAAITTIKRERIMAEPSSGKLHHTLLKVWHAWVGGAFLVAYVTADENTYAMHLFAGYAVLAAIVVRLLAGSLAPTTSPFRLAPPDIKGALEWISVRKGRNPLFRILAIAILASVGLAALSGAFADGSPWLEDPHEAISEASLWVIIGHMAFVFFMYGGKRVVGRIGAWMSDVRLQTPSKERVR